MIDAPKFTPGPWLVREPNPYTATIIKELSPDHVRIIASLIETGSETAANARLVSAAPDLYRAVEGLLAALDRAMDYIGNGYQPQDIVEEAREARDQAERFLARARGEAA